MMMMMSFICSAETTKKETTNHTGLSRARVASRLLAVAQYLDYLASMAVVWSTPGVRFLWRLLWLRWRWAFKRDRIDPHCSAGGDVFLPYHGLSHSVVVGKPRRVGEYGVIGFVPCLPEAMHHTLGNL
jgi:hypothetical protein